MPELPEVETTARGLKARVLKRTLVDVWSDWEKTVKRPSSFAEFRKLLKGKEILNVRRRAKNVILDLSGGYSLLVHQKMTGHLLYGEWKLDGGQWLPAQRGPMDDPYNRFLHLVFFLDNKKMIALSDVRKFAKVELWKSDELERELEKLGPEPLEKSFTVEKFKERIRQKRGKIKVALMDPMVIAGVGNIYANEALWMAKMHPARPTSKISEKELEELYHDLIEVLRLGVNLGGESIVDYRKVDGTRGEFDAERKIYQREGQKCHRCSAVIKRIVFAGRSSFICPKCQKA